MKRSLDELDLQSFGAGAAPIDAYGKTVCLTEPMASGFAYEAQIPFTLNGAWRFMEGDDGEWQSVTEWPESFEGEVPCGVHAALFKAGKIPDPMIGRNQLIARAHSYRTWWMRKEFAFSPVADKRYILCFEGVANRCCVWLNGALIAEHEGMFGGPDVDITDYLSSHNVLVVKLERIPYRHWGGPIAENNKSWADTVVINNVYGWHYFNMPSLGIWKSVYIREVSNVEIENPFIFTREAETGKMGLILDICACAPANAQVEASVRPYNFDGAAHSFRDEVALKARSQTLRYEFDIPDPRLWWPNGMGEPNLYELNVAIRSDGGESVKKCLFGIRTIRMEPLPDGPDEELYNWSFVINGKKMFIKGANWCTIDAMLDLSRSRYDRYLTLARMQHIQILRAWGAGMPETDDFYELCSLYGIMVVQEWPTAWNSHETQPINLLEETVVRNTRRLRNYPALVMYGGGNESPNPYGAAIDMMGRLAVELDGTRPYHRTGPWGGSDHDYDSYWDGAHVDHHLTADSHLWGEFGFASIPAYESFVRYMPEESLKIWPLEDNPDFILHTPCFGFRKDINHILQSANYFLPKAYKWEELITASQMIHALAVRRVLERARTRHPDCAGAIYYKMTDNSPAVSWACVDYYGVPKIAYYVFQDSFEPLHACVLFERTNFQGMPVYLPVYLLDDAGALPQSGWKVVVKAYDAALARIAEKTFDRKPAEGDNVQLGTFDLSMYETDSAPLLVVCDLVIDGTLVSRSFYLSNFEQDHGCMFRLPRAAVRIDRNGQDVTVSNVGRIPTVGVWLSIPGKNDTVIFDDNCLWLEPGESHTVRVMHGEAKDVEVDALNLM